MPSPSNAAAIVAGSSSPSGGFTTTAIGSPYFFANSKSRWSCAGTAITAPVPYSISTKFAAQIGIFAPVSGFTAYAPVKTPSFSISPAVRAERSSRPARSTNARTAASCAVPRESSATSGCSGASDMKVAPKSVSWRVVNTRTDPSRPASGKSMRAP